MFKNSSLLFPSIKKSFIQQISGFDEKKSLIFNNQKKISTNFCSSSNKRTYRAAVCKEFGKALVIEDKNTRTRLESGEIRVKVEASGVNFADLLVVNGKYQVKLPPPFTPGGEFSGVVLDVADDVEEFTAGMRVMGSVVSGAFAEEVVSSSEMVWKIPDKMTFEQAAAFLISYGTAFMGLVRRGKLKEGETLLVTAAAGATGLAAVDIASHVINSTVISCCGSDEKCELTKEKGSHVTINYNKEDIRTCVMRNAPRGVDVIFESVGGKVFKDCLRSIAWEGRLVVVGFASGQIPTIPANHLLVKNASTVGVYFGAYFWKDREIFNWCIDECLKYFQEGKINPYYCKVFRLEDINEAFSYISQRKSTGKVVITMKKPLQTSSSL